MAERPILFSGAMVRAILDGRKTQTRRVIKPQPEPFGVSSYGGTRQGWTWKPDSLRRSWNDDDKDPYRADPKRMTALALACECPYGKPGDRLWGRETLQWGARNNPEPRYNHLWRYAADNKAVMVSKEHETEMRVWAHHKEGDVCVSIHMPRWASRLTLEITKVRVERVQQITPDDCIAEGIEYPVAPSGTPGKVNPLINISDRNLTPHLMKIKGKYTHENLLIAHYAGLWDSINAKRDGGKYAWKKNPWVWVIEYKRVSL